MANMLWLDEAEGHPDAGGKARMLARARRAGLPVLDGFVVLPGEEVDEKAIAARLDRLGRMGAGEETPLVMRFAVRSSADLEDAPGLSAAGVFTSILDVGGSSIAAVAEAIERVRASARGEPARAYLGTRGVTKKVRMAVLVQPMAKAARMGVLHTEPVEDGTLAAEERDPGEPEWGEVRPRRVAVAEPLGAGALLLARLVGGAADVEYAVLDREGGEGGIAFLQARPLTGAKRAWEARRWVLEGADREATWVRDAEHNPEPLSAAQASLVALLDGTPGLARQRVLGGYLFFEEKARGEAVSSGGFADLPARFVDEIEPGCDALLSPLEAAKGDEARGTEEGLREALSVYVQVATRYRREVSPGIAAARRALDQLLQRSIGEGLARHGGLLAGTGGRTRARDSHLRAIGMAAEMDRAALISRYLAAYGAFSPVWDVAVPPDDEAEARVLAAAELVARGPSPEERHAQALSEAEAAARRVADRMDAAARAQLLAMLPSVRAAVAIAEDDDALFFRAQRAVRRPLFSIGQRHAKARSLDGAWQIFELPIDEVARGIVDAGRARSNRALREAARRLSPPSRIRAGVPSWRGGAESGAGVIAGAGTEGRAWGRAFVLRDPADAPPRLPTGAVLVADAILPSLTYLIPSAAALVTDHGGALSHAATLAREYGVPAVLGTGVATRALTDGDELLVDGDAGKVFLLGRR